MRRLRASLVAFVGAGITLTSAAAEPQPNTPIHRLIVLIQQNHSFDNYFGTYPRADGIPPDTCIPVDLSAVRLPKDLAGIERHPVEECIEPFYVGDGPIADLDSSADTFWRQYNGGLMNGFVDAINRKGQDGRLAMGYYDDRTLPFYWNLADEYVLFDRYFASAHGGTLANLSFALAAVPGDGQRGSPLGSIGSLPTIFDRLQARGISWKYYVQNYDSQLDMRSPSESWKRAPQVQWVPLLRIPRFLDDPALSSRIVDLSEYFEDLEHGNLPAVSYILALGATEHPLANVRLGQRITTTLIQALQQSDQWHHAALVLAYDDWGGTYDHVPPPQVDDYGYGFRVPALLVSPYARRGFVDSTQLDSTSILKFIEENYSLEPLADRDARANSIASGFDFSRPPRKPRFVPVSRGAELAKPKPRRAMIFVSYGAAVLFAAGLILRPILVVGGSKPPE